MNPPKKSRISLVVVFVLLVIVVGLVAGVAVLIVSPSSLSEVSKPVTNASGEQEPTLLPWMTMMQHPGTPWNVSHATTEGWYALGVGMTREYKEGVYTAVCARMVLEVNGDRVNFYDDPIAKKPELIFFPECCPMPGGNVTGSVFGMLVPVNQMPRAERIDVILIPDLSAIPDDEQVSAYWNEEIRLKDVPLNWSDIDDVQK